MLFAYRKLQYSIVAKAIECNVPVIIVSPKGTSKTCPICGVKLAYIHRLAICSSCEFKRDRDVIGAMNVWLRALYAYAGEPGSPKSASAMKGETRQSGGTRGEGMKQAIKSA